MPINTKFRILQELHALKKEGITDKTYNIDTSVDVLQKALFNLRLKKLTLVIKHEACRNENYELIHRIKEGYLMSIEDY